LFDIDFQGARQIRAKVPDVASVFILPPSMPELLKRLRGRALDEEDVVQRRFQVAMREIEHYALFDYVVVNDDLERAAESLIAVVRAERAKRWRVAPVAEKLLRSGETT
jgi:guanylate kinase